MISDFKFFYKSNVPMICRTELENKLKYLGLGGGVQSKKLQK